MLAGCITHAELTAAYRAGDTARDSGTITPDDHQLYELLLRLNTRRLRYIFAGFTALAGMIGVCAKTIQRRMERLVAAGLVWRQRQLNKPWLTVISAFAPQPTQADFFDAAAVRLDETPESSPPLRNHDSDLGGGSALAPEPASDAGPTPPQTHPAPTHRVDRPNSDSSAALAPVDPAVSEKMALLRSGGVANPRVCQELALAQPLDRIRRTVETALASGGAIGGGAVVDALRQGYALCLRPTRRQQRGDRRTGTPPNRSITPQPDPAQILAGRAERLAANRRMLEEMGLGRA